MARAGFVYTGLEHDVGDPSAQCFICDHDLVWESADEDPMYG
jgi:hypothetical protein